MKAQQRSNASMQSAVQVQLPEPEPNNNPTIAAIDNLRTSANATDREFRREFRWLERGSLLANIALAGIGIGALYIYGGQLKVMQGQLDQMRRSTDQSEQLIKEAIRQNSMAQSALELNRLQTTLTRQQVTSDHAAVIKFQVGSRDSYPSIGLRALNLELWNEGHAIAGNVMAEMIVTLQGLPKRQVIDVPLKYRWGPGPVRESGQRPLGGNTNHVFKSFSVPYLSDDTWQAAQKYERTVQIDTVISYDNGFGETIKDTSCQVLLAPAFYYSNPTILRRTEPYFVECDGFDAKLREAIEQTRIAANEARKQVQASGK